MCGIAGFAGQGSRETLERMAGALQRRGPDDEGLYEAAGVGFAFRRLSIIDVEGGHQPLSNEDGSVWVMLNGEIYGYGTLRERLQSEGHVFRTRSDTEVIVHAYETWGERCFEQLNGMFACAVWDTHTSRLMLARDRLGKKPLYWTTNAGTLWFASEMKALLAAGIVLREIDPFALDLYFRTDAVPTPRTIFSGVLKLEPATILCWHEGNVERMQRFWSVAISEPYRQTIEQATQTVSDVIDQAVRERLVSDVPLGIFLSGGMDSTVVAASAAKQSTMRRMAFTIGFDDPSHDESDMARSVAHALGYDHHVERLRAEDALAMLDEAQACLDEPLADPAILPQMLLARFARQQITVALTGDGGDELLCGYPHVPVHAFAMRFPRAWSWSYLLRPLCASVPASEGYFSAGFRCQRLARGLGVSDPYARDVRWRGAWMPADVNALLMPAWRERVQMHFAEEQLRSRAYELGGDASEWQRWSWAYLRTFLMDEVLVKVDRATMWYGLEARSPLLDPRVVEACLALPDRYKVGALGGKQIFKRMLRGVVPDAVLDHPKHGFGVPTSRWLNGALAHELARVTEPAYLARQGLFDHHVIDRMRNEHRKGRPDRRRELWALLLFQRWYERYAAS